MPPDETRLPYDHAYLLEAARALHGAEAAVALEPALARLAAAIAAVYAWPLPAGTPPLTVPPTAMLPDAAR